MFAIDTTDAVRAPSATKKRIPDGLTEADMKLREQLNRDRQKALRAAGVPVKARTPKAVAAPEPVATVPEMPKRPILCLATSRDEVVKRTTQPRGEVQVNLRVVRTEPEPEPKKGKGEGWVPKPQRKAIKAAKKADIQKEAPKKGPQGPMRQRRNVCHHLPSAKLAKAQL